ncbi:HU family DNA-binding protein [Phocaeicola sp.]
MAAKYDFKVSPDIQGKEEKTTLYPKIVVSGTKTIENLVEDISRHSGFKSGMVLGLMNELENIMTDYLAQGYNVKLGEIGTFSATLTSRKVTDKNEIRAASVHFDNVKFKPTPYFLGCIYGKGHLERVDPEYGFNTSSAKYTKEKRFKLLTAYLKEHTFITRKEYSGLTGLLKTKAANELREWEDNKLIVRKGRVPHIIYLAMPEKEQPASI